MSWKERTTREEEVEVKESFKKHYEKLLGKDYEKFMQCNLQYLARAIRINPIKTSKEETKKSLENKGWKLTPVPWCDEAFWMEGERLDIGNTLEHQLGYIYIQDPASMLPPIILDPQPDETLLDMCASPGSKTSQAAAMMKNTGIIVANDLQGDRLAPLGVNLQRMGVYNTVLTKRDGRTLGKLSFDRVMVDAPCSGTGTIRRSLKSINMWNINQIKKLGRIQGELIQAGYNALQPGGTMTYSTCTLEPLENEVVVSAFLNNNPEANIHEITLNIKRETPFNKHPITEEDLHPEITKCLRIHPYTNDTEGFFVAKITKPA